jgi:hypothetical protein
MLTQIWGGYLLSVLALSDQPYNHSQLCLCFHGRYQDLLVVAYILQSFASQLQTECQIAYLVQILLHLGRL